MAQAPERPALVSANASELNRRLQRRFGTVLIDTFFSSISEMFRRQPLADPRLHGVECLRNISYLDEHKVAHLLDIYRPTGRRNVGDPPWPVVFYVHGGGFRKLSKDTHWVMALGFARRGYLVVNINYRLAPKYCYPIPLQDTCAAYEWVINNIARYGGDPQRIAVAGESAGANLITALTLATAYERPEPFAQRVWQLNAPPKLAMPACGILQVSQAAQRRHSKRVPLWLSEYIALVSESYLPHPDGSLTLADPLTVLESALKPTRALPPFFIAAGLADPIVEDSERLREALTRHGVRTECCFFEGEPHAFHAFLWRKRARECWRNMLECIDGHMLA